MPLPGPSSTRLRRGGWPICIHVCTAQMPTICMYTHRQMQRASHQSCCPLLVHSLGFLLNWISLAGAWTTWLDGQANC